VRGGDTLILDNWRMLLRERYRSTCYYDAAEYLRWKTTMPEYDDETNGTINLRAYYCRRLVPEGFRVARCPWVEAAGRARRIASRISGGWFSKAWHSRRICRLRL